MNYTTTKRLLAFLLLLATTVTQAQITVGPRLGANLASAHYSFDLDTKVRVGMQGGVVLNAQFGRLAIQPSLLFSQKGYKIDNSESALLIGSTGNIKSEANVLLNYLEVPVNLVYSRDGNQGFQLFAGPYIGVGLSGKFKGETEFIEDIPNGSTNNYINQYDYKVQFTDEQGNDENKAYFQRLNLGLNGGVGYKIGSIQTQLSYMFGLSNMLPSSNTSSRGSLKDRTVQLSLAYFFSAHK